MLEKIKFLKMEGRIDFDSMAANYDELSSLIGVEEILDSIETLSGKPKPVKYYFYMLLLGILNPMPDNNILDWSKLTSM